MGVEINGLDNILVEIERLGMASREVEGEALQTAGDFVLKKATYNLKKLGGVKTGKMLSSLKVSKIRKGKNGNFVWVGDVDRQAVTKKGEPYVWYYEYGTSNQPARPFLRPAFFNNRDEVRNIMRGIIKKRLGL